MVNRLEWIGPRYRYSSDWAVNTHMLYLYLTLQIVDNVFENQQGMIIGIVWNIARRYCYLYGTCIPLNLPEVIVLDWNMSIQSRGEAT